MGYQEGRLGGTDSDPLSSRYPVVPRLVPPCGSISPFECHLHPLYHPEMGLWRAGCAACVTGVRDPEKITLRVDPFQRSRLGSAGATIDRGVAPI
jgi:hypothetical protein